MAAGDLSTFGPANNGDTSKMGQHPLYGFPVCSSRPPEIATPAGYHVEIDHRHVQIKGAAADGIDRIKARRFGRAARPLDPAMKRLGPDLPGSLPRQQFHYFRDRHTAQMERFHEVEFGATPDAQRLGKPAAPSFLCNCLSGSPGQDQKQSVIVRI